MDNGFKHRASEWKTLALSLRPVLLVQLCFFDILARAQLIGLAFKQHSLGINTSPNNRCLYMVQSTCFIIFPYFSLALRIILNFYNTQLTFHIKLETAQSKEKGERGLFCFL